jgi:hypothetical protein
MVQMCPLHLRERSIKGKHVIHNHIRRKNICSGGRPGRGQGGSRGPGRGHWGGKGGQGRGRGGSPLKEEALLLMEEGQIEERSETKIKKCRGRQKGFGCF